MASTTEDKLDKLETEVVKIKAYQANSREKLEDISVSAKENFKQVTELGALVSNVDKTLGILCERVANSLANSQRLEAKVEKTRASFDARFSGVEDTISDHSNSLATIRTELSSLIDKSSLNETRRWSMITLVPVALITALVSSSVAYIYDEVKSDNVAIKQTQIDKLQEQLDSLLKASENGS